MRLRQQAGKLSLETQIVGDSKHSKYASSSEIGYNLNAFTCFSRGISQIKIPKSEKSKQLFLILSDIIYQRLYKKGL